jgi:hypothetical protein
MASEARPDHLNLEQGRKGQVHNGRQRIHGLAWLVQSGTNSVVEGPGLKTFQTSYSMLLKMH